MNEESATASGHEDELHSFLHHGDSSTLRSDAALPPSSYGTSPSSPPEEATSSSSFFPPSPSSLQDEDIATPYPSPDFQNSPVLLDQPGASSPLVTEWVSDIDTDVTVRRSLLPLIDDPGEYTAEENHFLGVASNMMAMEDSSEVQTKKYDTKTPLLSASIMIDKTKSDKSNHVYGKAVCFIRGASPEDLVAYSMHYNSIISDKYERSPNAITKSTLETINNHHRVLYLKVMVPPPFQKRDFVGSFVFKKQDSRDAVGGTKQYLCIVHPTTHEGAPLHDQLESKSSSPSSKSISRSSFSKPEDYAVRGESIRVLRFTEVSPNVTKYELVFQVDMKGHFPQFLNDKVTIPSSVTGPSRVQRHFMQIKKAGDYDREGLDGDLLGQLLMDGIGDGTAAEEEQERVLLLFLTRASALREIVSKYDWFDKLLLNIIIAKKRFAKFESAHKNLTPLSQYTAEDTLVASKSLAKYTVGNFPRDAVDVWMSKNLAMEQLEEEYRMFRPFIVSVVKRVTERRDWGMNARVYVGALLSVSDMITDTNMIVQFLKQGQASAAYATIAMISLNLFVQLLLVYGQNKKKGRQAVAIEMLIVLSFLKPGVDAYRVIIGGDKDPLLTMDPLAEMTMSKLLEVGLESVG